LVTKTLSYFAGPGPAAPGIAVTVSAAAAGPASTTARTSPISPDRMAAQPTMGVVAVLIASDLSKDMAGEPLLRGVSFKLERRERMTIAGRNGAGKTTLLRMLSGETSIDGGELVLAKGRASRCTTSARRANATSACANTFSRARASRSSSRRSSSASSTRWPRGRAGHEPLRRRAARFEAVGGYGWRERARSVVHGLGFVDDDLDRALRTFSGGQLTRASLARALAAQPDLLLLDEPTNHLDIESLEWLEQTLLDLDAAIVLVAHDRWFLETVGTSVLELEAGRARFFNGTWHAWRREQAARELALGRAIEKQQAEIERMERFVERFRFKATKARQAQDRLKKLSKIERIERDPRDGPRPGVRLQEARALGARDLRARGRPPAGRRRSAARPARRRRAVARARRARLARRAQRHRQDDPHPGARRRAPARRRPAALGPQRQGRLPQPARRGARGRRRAHRARGGDQAHRAAAQPGARAARRFLFSGDEVDKPLDGLSGGERRRLSLAILVQSGSNVLILDEPTNHLDLESREALEDALQAFPGSLILVTHDRALLDAVGTRTIAVEDYGLRSYVGGWAEYARVREERKAMGLPPSSPPAPVTNGASRAEGRAAEKPKARPEKPKPDGPSKNRVREQARLERAVEEAEAALAVVEDELADAKAWATKYETAKSTARHTAAKRAVEEAYEALESFEAKV
jgi:ATP-binding cassette subfamily F protein 3